MTVSIIDTKQSEDIALVPGTLISNEGPLLSGGMMLFEINSCKDSLCSINGVSKTNKYKEYEVTVS